MSKKRATIVATIGLLIGLVGFAPASAKTPTESPICGAPLDHPIKLGADVGSKTMTCPMDGLVITKDHVTIDLNGHTIWGPGTLATGGKGIHADGFTHTHITNGTIRGFFDGVSVGGAADHTTVDHVISTGNNHSGIFVAGTIATITHNSVLGNVRDGMFLAGTGFVVTNNIASGNALSGIDMNTGADGATISQNTTNGNASSGISAAGSNTQTIKKNTASGNNDFGITTSGSGDVISKNAVLGNNSGGIKAAGAGPAISNNTANGNGWGTLDGSGLGIDASTATTPTGSQNIAHGNDDGNECNPTSLC